MEYAFAGISYITYSVKSAPLDAIRLLYTGKLSSPIHKSQRKTNNLGFNTARTQDESYAKIEENSSTARCSDGKHIGERILPIRMFYLNKGGLGLQGACIPCQKNRRADRIKRSRARFNGKTKEEVYDMYKETYGQTKICSKCNTPKPPTEFPISRSMETGIHNHCFVCSVNQSGHGDLRDFIYFPDKDGIKYEKEVKCARCGRTEDLAVDHILPIAKGGSDCIQNKQTLCTHCNSSKSDTLDCTLTAEFLSTRYRDPSLNFSDNKALTLILSRKVYEFLQSHIVNATSEEIRSAVKDYITKYNLGHNLDRIVRKITDRFDKG
jgi:hypothetical protein